MTGIGQMCRHFVAHAPSLGGTIPSGTLPRCRFVVRFVLRVSCSLAVAVDPRREPFVYQQDPLNSAAQRRRSSSPRLPPPCTAGTGSGSGRRPRQSGRQHRAGGASKTRRVLDLTLRKMIALIVRSPRSGHGRGPCRGRAGRENFMALNIHAELKRLRTLKTPQLKARYAELFGEPTRCNNRPYLIKRIAWRLQADAEGDLSERARQRAAEMADDAICGCRPRSAPRPTTISDARPQTRHRLAPRLAGQRRRCRGRRCANVQGQGVQRDRAAQGLLSARARSTARCRRWPTRSPAATGTVRSSSPTR